MGAVIPSQPHRNAARQAPWERLARADLWAQYRAWRTQGISERQAANALKVPRTPLPAWRLWHARLDICAHGAAGCQRGPGLAFLHRLVMAGPRVGVAVGAGGMRWVWLLLPLTGLDRFVAASDGAQQPVTRQGEPAIGAYGPPEPARWATARPPQARTVPQDDTCPGGLGLLPLAPESTGILVAPLAQARAHTPGHALRAPALAPLPGRVLPSTSDAAPGLLASGEHSREAPHSPALVHGQPELVQAVAGPMATQERAASKAVTAAREPLAHLQTGLQSAGAEPATPRPSRPPQAAMRLEHAAPALAAAPHEYARLAQQRPQSKAPLRGIGHAAPFVALVRGVRRNGPRITADRQGPIAPMRTLAPPAGLSPSCGERFEQAARVGPKRRAPRECVSGDGRRQGAPLTVTPPGSCARHAKLIPSSALARIAQTRTVRDGAPLRARAERRRIAWWEPGGVVRALSPAAQDRLHDAARRLAAVCQRSRANVAGRTGY